VELVHWRAELLSLSPRPSCAGMAAVVGPGAGEVARAVVEDVDDTGALAVAAVDGPSQVLLAGGCEALARARETVLAAGLDLVRLPGRTACHGPLVAPVARHLGAAFADLEWSEPDVPVVPNADGRPTRDPEQLARCLRAHLTSPVQWEATSRALVEAGATEVVEVAAVPVLGPLIRQVHPDLPVHLAAGPGTPLPTTPPEPAPAVPVPHRRRDMTTIQHPPSAEGALRTHRPPRRHAPQPPARRRHPRPALAGQRRLDRRLHGHAHPRARRGRHRALAPVLEEFLYCQSGDVLVTLDGEERRLTTESAVHIPLGVKHRIVNDTAATATFVFFCGPLAPRPELGHVDTEPSPGSLGAQ
jgi:malonyl CoA-acyl carrier protein transacylase